MATSQSTFTRRSFLGAAAALVPLAGCGGERTPAARPTATPSPVVETARKRDPRDRLVALERRFDARLGVYALATGTGTEIAYRADARFAFCSTFKALAAAAVLRLNPLSHLDDRIAYSEADLLPHAPITSQHVAAGMTVRELCDAAVRYSDGPAGNLLVRDLGGPARLTAFLRGLGDTVTRMDRVEPAITEATPGDRRDTTSPRALGTDYGKIVLGDVLPAAKRAFLRDLLERNTTGDHRIRAGVPRGWTVADKTGTGSYGTLNDVAIVWPRRSAPLVLAIMSRKSTQDADGDEALIAEAAEHVVAALT
jgi:beta-lactamase class A